ncbi:MAG: hypothetical protein ABIG66_00280 [Candidatus Kerfeldbacteria bacterium]
MADDVQFVPVWEDETTQCKNCTQFQSQDGKNACVPPDMAFETAIERFGEVPPTGHCNFFASK